MFKKNRISASVAMENILSKEPTFKPLDFSKVPTIDQIDSGCLLDEDKELRSRLTSVITNPEATEEEKAEAGQYLSQLGGND